MCGSTCRQSRFKDLLASMDLLSGPQCLRGRRVMCCEASRTIPWANGSFAHAARTPRLACLEAAESVLL